MSGNRGCLCGERSGGAGGRKRRVILKGNNKNYLFNSICAKKNTFATSVNALTTGNKLLQSKPF